MGDTEYANKYLKSIIRSKADGVIFHIREKSFYQNKKTSKFELPDEFYFQASKKLKKNRIQLGIALADPEKLDLCERFKADFYKIFSRDVLKQDLVNLVHDTRKKVFVSTGMSDLSEIKKFMDGIKKNKKQITLIHTQLNNNLSFANLKAIPILKNKFHVNIAYGNHTKNINILYTVLAFEPTDVLFYVKGNKAKKHIDETHAVPLDDLSEIIYNLRELPNSLGKKKIKMNNQIE